MSKSSTVDAVQDNPQSYKSGDTGPNGGIIEWITPVVMLEWLDDRAIQCITAFDLSRANIDLFIEKQNTEVRPRLRQDLPQFTILDGRTAMRKLTTRDAMYCVTKLQSQSRQHLSIRGAWIAVMMNDDLVSSMVSFAVRTLSGISRNVHLQMFFKTDDALKWLRMNAQKLESRQSAK